jgi:MazG family protein
VTPPQPNPALPSDSSGTLDRALELVRFLRANCEWDAAQTPRSLVQYLLEEARETADAIEADDVAHLAAELGDLLLNVAFQIVIAEERGAFTADDVASGLEAKMRRRHPHLYGDGPRMAWDELKRAESEGRDAITVASASAESAAAHSLIDDVAVSLAPLERAHGIQARVAEVGFDWPDAGGAFEKVQEETEEVGEMLHAADAAGRDRLEEEIGDLFFAVVNLARLSGVDSVQALRRANAKFCGRFRQLERLAAERGVVLGEASLEELDALWSVVKE